MNYDDLINRISGAVKNSSKQSMFTGRLFDREALTTIVSTPDALKSELGYPKNKRWRKTLSNLMGLCHNVRYLVAGQDGLAEFALSSNAPSMIKRFGGQRMASKVMRKAQQIGLLQCTDAHYSYKYGKAKCYIWHKETAELVMSLGKSLSLSPTQYHSHTSTLSTSSSQYHSQTSTLSTSSSHLSLNGRTICDGATSREEGEILSSSSPIISNPSSISFNSLSSTPLSSLNGRTICNGATERAEEVQETSPSSSSIINGRTICPTIGKMRARVSVEEVEPGLYAKYPQLEYGQRLADELNEEYHQEAPEEWIRFDPHFNFSKSKMLTKVGIRATSSACSCKSREKAQGKASEGEEKPYYGTYREDYLSALFGKPYEELYHYDRTASIYNLTYFLNHGVWLSDDVPLYAHMQLGIPVGGQ